ncbi:MAG: TonB-dependent receptor [Lutibacter sp.]|nr:TonB-dependent receptor [Lutibacter sp.]
MKSLLLSIFLCFVGIFGYAQNYEIKGIVVDTNGDPLPGVSIIVKNTVKGASTSFEGNFTVANVQKGETLVFSFLGFVTKEIVINNDSLLNVTLKEDTESLDEIVVIGYGTQKKKEVTGAVSVIDSKAIERLNPTRVEQALQGQVSGVNITSSSGSPGSGSNIRIRGISTNGDNRPLILVDGNVIEDLSVINPSDIQSVNVLKDATAGIYGVRAANGVILITTKTGRKDSKMKYQFDAYTGVQETSKKIDLLKPRDFAIYVNDAADKTKFFVYPTEGTDWQDEVFKEALIYNMNFSASGGTKKSAYSFGLSYLDQDGIVGLSKSNYTRTTARYSYQYDMLKNLKLSTTGIYTNSKKNNLPEGGIGSVLYSTVNLNPNLPVRDENGAYSLVEEIKQIELINPLAQIANTFNTATVDKFSATVGIDYTFWEHFTASSKFQMNHATVLDDVFRPEVNYGPSKGNNVALGKNEVVDYGGTFDDYTWDNYINYTNTFNEDHNLTVLLGTSIFQTTGEFYGLSGYTLKNGSNSFSDASIDNLEGEVKPRFNESQLAIGSNVFDTRLQSAFTRVQYNYKGKYLFSGVFRRDGSSKFGTNNKYGYFPSGSIGWNVSEEDFLQNSSWINSLKLRASYGIIGNDRIGDFGYISRLSGEATYATNNEVVEADLLNGVAEGVVANPSIRWEKQKTENIGFDATIFSNKVSIAVDAFSKKTEDLLINAQASALIGASAPGSGTPIINAGTVENRGIEFKIGYEDNFSDDFKFNVSFNISTLENEVLFVESENGFIDAGEYGVGLGINTSRMEAGQPLGYFYGYKTNGIYQTFEEIDALDAASPEGEYHSGAGPGDLKFLDTNENGYIDAGDKTYLGDPIPDITMGFNLGFNYKNLDFSSSAFASIGNDMVRDYERKDLFANRGEYVLDRWQGTGTSNSIPRALSGKSINTDNFSDFYVEDASYVRLQNVQVGYTFNPETLAGIGIEKLRVYLSGNNLVTITDYKGYDPSASSGDPLASGIDKGFYPVAKSYLFGINLIF